MGGAGRLDGEAKSGLHGGGWSMRGCLEAVSPPGSQLSLSCLPGLPAGWMVFGKVVRRECSGTRGGALESLTPSGPRLLHFKGVWLIPSFLPTP